MMDKVFARDLAADAAVDSPFLVADIQVRQKKNGEDFLTFTLADRTGEVKAVLWEGVEEAQARIAKGDYALVTGKVSLYNEALQVTLYRIRRLDPSEVDPADFIPATERDVEKMWSELTEALALIRDPKLRELVDQLLGDEAVADGLRRSPAAKRHHHVYLGGLLEHTLSLLRLCQVVAAHYPELDRDLLLAGGLLHDIGKISELRYEREFDYSEEGRLVGHIVMAAADLDRRMRGLGFPDKLRAKVLHLVVSHHGEQEFGSPKVPMTLEAVALHYIDMLDSRLAIARDAIAREAGSPDPFTSWNHSLERHFYKG
jgi:3'-5' exoribonuclease